MAYSTELSNTHSGVNAWISGLMNTALNGLAQRRVYHSTLGELQSLSNRELADLGLSRSMLRRIAYQAAYEA